MEKYYGVKGRTLQRQYKNKLSNYRLWEQLDHCKNYLVFEQNIGPYLSLDETCFSKGELYTILSNKSKKGKKGSVVPIIKGIKSDYNINILTSISATLRYKVKEITLDMAGNMNLIAQKCFPKATRVTDRFHVQKLAYDAVQQLRIKHRWEAIEASNNSTQPEKELRNQDTLKQLWLKTKIWVKRDFSISC